MRRPNGFTYEEVKYQIEVESGSGCKLVSDKYTRAGDALVLQCRCGKEFKTSLHKFKGRGKQQCTDCGYRARAKGNRLTYENVKRYIEIESKSGCLLLSRRYENRNQKLLISCKCGKTYKTTWNNFKFDGKQRCDECAGHTMWDYSRVKDFIETKNDCKLLSKEYHSPEDEISIKCMCGKTFLTTFYKIRYNTNVLCPHCSESKGERKIRKYLEEIDISFKQEYSFSDLKGVGGGSLRFDFYLPHYNSLIEYDGEFHYIQLFDEHDLRGQQIHDNLKDNYCKHRGISLLRIPYWEFENIEKIIDIWLKQQV